MNAKILVIKWGQVETLTFSMEASMKARFVKSCDIVKIHSLGAEGNDVGLKKHHGGVDKALFFMSADSFNELNALLNKDFSYMDTFAIYGENFVVSEADEDNVCIGDRYPSAQPF